MVPGVVPEEFLNNWGGKAGTLEQAGVRKKGGFAFRRSIEFYWNSLWNH
jgi:hypothetical protein